MPLLAPQESTITLTSTSTVVQANGTAEIRATVVEKGGTPVQNGTTVTFTTNLGTLSPTEARTVNGAASVQFVANGQSGTAQIGAVSGGAKAENISLTVGAAAASRVAVTANPNQIPSGGTSQITATLTDTNGNPLNGVQVAFSTDAGSLSSSMATTNFAGQAQVTLSTNRDATVKATAGAGGTGAAGVTGEVKVTVTSSPDLTITTTTTNPTEDQVVTFTVTVGSAGTTSESFQSLIVDFDDGTNSGVLSGSSQTVSHVYRSSGTFTVVATATTPSGTTKRATTVVSVTPRGIIDVTITRSPSDTINVNEVVTFTASTAATDVRTYSWNFGDGRTFTGGSQVSHTYSSTGRKTVTVTATATDGNRGVGRIEFVVEP
jgi:PKD repeat protein